MLLDQIVVTPTTQIDLPPDPRSARRARGFVTASLSSGFIDVADTVQLLVSELVTNAILHARTAVTLRIIPTDERVRVEVEDRSPIAAAERHYGPEATTGRGLSLVTALAHAWGTEPTSSGKLVWFELAV